MKMNVKDLHDISLIQVPEELLEWEVTPEQIDSQLVLLSKINAVEELVDKVEEKDCVVCQCLDGRLSDRVVFIYPGLHLPGALEAEKCSLEKTIDDVFETDLNGYVKLKVQKIIRRMDAIVNDAFVQSLEIEGVDTIEKYRDWYKKETEASQKGKVIKNIQNYLLDSIAQNSTYEEVDAKEMDAFLTSQAKQLVAYENEMTGESVELTDEWLDEIKESVVFDLKREAVGRKLCEQEGIVYTSEMFEDEIKQTVPEEMSEMMEEYKDMYVRNAYFTKAYELLENCAKKYLEV